MTAGIYIIENRVDGKFYIGSAVDLVRRERIHRRHLRRGAHHNRPMQMAWVRDGEGAFAFRTLLICAREHLLMYEQLALDTWQAPIAGYNLHPVAGSFLGYKRGRFSVEHRAALRAAWERTRTERTGAKRTAEQKANMRAAQKRLRDAGFKNSPIEFTDAVRAKISASLTGKRLSPESIAKMAASKRGRVAPPEERAKLSAAQTRVWAKRKAEAACPQLV